MCLGSHRVLRRSILTRDQIHTKAFSHVVCQDASVLAETDLRAPCYYICWRGSLQDRRSSRLGAKHDHLRVGLSRLQRFSLRPRRIAKCGMHAAPSVVEVLRHEISSRLRSSARYGTNACHLHVEYANAV